MDRVEAEANGMEAEVDGVEADADEAEALADRPEAEPHGLRGDADAPSVEAA